MNAEKYRYETIDKNSLSEVPITGLMGLVHMNTSV
jgi:hypothetical protein